MLYCKIYVLFWQGFFAILLESFVQTVRLTPWQCQPLEISIVQLWVYHPCPSYKWTLKFFACRSAPKKTHGPNESSRNNSDWDTELPLALEVGVLAPVVNLALAELSSGRNLLVTSYIWLAYVGKLWYDELSANCITVNLCKLYIDIRAW